MTDVLKATRDRDAWKVMITYDKEQGTRLIDGKMSLTNVKVTYIYFCTCVIIGAFKPLNPVINVFSITIVTHKSL